MTTKRWFLVGALLFLATALCFATGGSEEESAGGEITVWDWFKGSSGSQGVLAEALGAAFEERFPDIALNHESVPHPPYEVYQAAIAARSGADAILVHANGQNFQDLGEAFVVLDDHIQDIWDQFPEATLADTAPERDISQGVRGLPVTVQGWVWYYNKALFEEAGLDPENPPTTWDGLISAAEALQAAGITPIGFGQGIHAEMMIAGTLDQVLSESQKRDLLAGDITFEAPIILETFQRFQDLYQAGYIDPEGMTVPLLRDKGEEFMAGESAIFRGFVSDIFNWYEFGEALGAENLGVIPNFYFEGSAHEGVVGAAGGIAYAVPTYSDNQAAAIEWVRFAAGEEGANILLANGGAVPANGQADESLVANQVGVEVMELVANSLVSPTKAFTPTPLWNVIRSHGPLLFSGEITPAEYGATIEQAR